MLKAKTLSRREVTISFDDDQKDLAYGTYQQFMAAIPKRPTKKELTDSLHRILELTRPITESLKAELATEMDCKKGCNYCCNQKIPLRVFDMEMLVYSLPKRLSREAMERVRTKKKLIDKGGEDIRIAPCALLDENGACSVYDDRPYSCRTYYSRSSKSCEIGNPEGVQLRALDFSIAEIIFLNFTNGDQKEYVLEDLLLAAFRSKGVRKHPIKL